MNESMQQNPRAALLARCSSEASVCSQVLTLRQYAREQFEVAEDAVYADNISGASALEERPELQRLMAGIESGARYDVVLVQDRARLGRAGHQEQLLRWFGARGIAVRFVADEAIS